MRRDLVCMETRCLWSLLQVELELAILQCFLWHDCQIDWKTVLVFYADGSSRKGGIGLHWHGMGISSAHVGIEWFGKRT